MRRDWQEKTYDEPEAIAEDYNRGNYLKEEKEVILAEINSILRWDKIDLSWWEVKAWELVRKIVIRLTNK